MTNVPSVRGWSRFVLRFLIIASWVLVLSIPAPSRADELKRAIRQLDQGRAEAALLTLSKLLERAGPSVAPGEKNLESLGVALLYRAVAEYQVGKPREARWSWQMAKQFFPDLEGMDLSSLGPANEFLKAQSVVEPEIQFGGPVHSSELPEGLTAPEKIHAPAPRYSEGSRSHGFTGIVRVSAVVREDGTLDDPRVVEPWPAPSLVYSTLDSLRQWRFRPAERVGVPIPIRYLIWINYKLE
ncbi:MAG: hypothetical protein AMXMBFR36_20770 [Acidobacteriota bacterium]